MAKSRLQRLYERRAWEFNQKAAFYGLRGTVSAEELAAMPLVCEYCRDPLTHDGSEFDHVIPFTRNGTNDVSNIVRACRRCNREKYRKTPEEWASYMNTTWVCPVDGTVFRPRYADWVRGQGRYCSRACSAKSRWI